MIRARRLRVSNGQQGIIQGQLYRPFPDQLFFYVYGFFWKLPRSEKLSLPASQILRPGEQRDCTLRAREIAGLSRSLTIWEVKPLGKAQPITNEELHEIQNAEKIAEENTTEETITTNFTKKEKAKAA